MVFVLPRSRPLVYADLENISEDGHRYELLDGSLLVTPAPGTAHQRAVLRLGALLDQAGRPDLEALVAPYDWVVDTGERSGVGTSFEPDVLVARREDLGPKYLSVPPVVVVEVLSPSSRRSDLVLKRNVYAAAGVPWYWIVDPETPSVVVLRLLDGIYVEEVSAAGNAPCSVEQPFAVTIVPEELVS